MKGLNQIIINNEIPHQQRSIPVVKILQKIVDICSEGRKAEGGKAQSNIRAIDLLPFKQ